MVNVHVHVQYATNLHGILNKALHSVVPQYSWIMDRIDSLNPTAYVIIINVHVLYTMINVHALYNVCVQ